MALNLGDEVKDKVTGFQGVVTAVTFWINGCVRLLVQPRKLLEGRPIEALAFDIAELQLVKKNASKPVVKQEGGPMPVAKRGMQTPK